MDNTAIPALDALTKVALAALGEDATAVVTAVTADHQIVVSQAAWGNAPRPSEPLPLSHSVCRHVVLGGEAFVIEDLRRDPVHKLVVRDLGVGAYAGFPLHGPRGSILGAVCAVTPGPRVWSAADLQILRSLTTAAEFVVAMLAMARRDRLARVGGAVPVDPVARIQHGLRTPLTSLLGFLDLLIDGDVGEFTDDQLEALRRCHTNALRLRDAILTLT